MIRKISKLSLILVACTGVLLAQTTTSSINVVGQTGPAGPPGPPGTPGAAGTNGTNGTNGINGINGAPAPPINTTTLTDLSTSLAAGVITVAPGTWGVGTNTCQITSPVTITPIMLAVVGATNASTITLTLNSASWLHSGDTTTVAGVGGTTTANGTWNVIVDDPTHIDLMGPVGNGNYTGGGTVGGAGNGVMYIEGNDSCSISVFHSQAAGLVVALTGSAVENQIAKPVFDPGSTPIATAVVSNGKIVSVTDARHILSNSEVTVGPQGGLTIQYMGGVAVLGFDPTVPRTTQGNIFTGQNTFTGGMVFTPAGTQPTCDANHVNWYWHTPGSATVDGALQICDYKGGTLQWVSH